MYCIIYAANHKKKNAWIISNKKKTTLSFFLILIIFITKIIIKGLVNLLCIKTRVSIHSWEQQSILPHGQLILPGFLSICLGDVAGLGWEHDCFYSWACFLLRLTHQLILHLPLLCLSSPGFPPCPSLSIEATNGSASCINFD